MLVPVTKAKIVPVYFWAYYPVILSGFSPFVFFCLNHKKTRKRGNDENNKCGFYGKNQ
jgi:hypothetical protein